MRMQGIGVLPMMLLTDGHPSNWRTPSPWSTGLIRRQAPSTSDEPCQIRTCAAPPQLQDSASLDAACSGTPIHSGAAMSTFQDRVRELKGFLGKLLPRAASRSRRSLHEPSEEVSGCPARHAPQSAGAFYVVLDECSRFIIVLGMAALLER